MHVFYIFCFELYVVLDQKPSMLPAVTKFVAIVDYRHCVLVSNVTLGFTCCRIQTRIESNVCNEFSDNSFKIILCIMYYK